MLYKLRNNVLALFNKDRNGTDFVYIRTSFFPVPAYARVLSYKAQELSVIVEKITGEKGDNNGDEIYYGDELRLLEDYGFLISGNTEEELVKKEIPLYRGGRLK